MKRLLVLPAALAGCLAVGLWTGYAWPVALTAYRWVAAEATAETEDDVVA